VSDKGDLARFCSWDLACPFQRLSFNQLVKASARALVLFMSVDVSDFRNCCVIACM
jgi:hypothetical protein